MLKYRLYYIINRQTLFFANLFNTLITRFDNVVRVKKIKNKVYNYYEYAAFNFYFFNNFKVAKISRKARIIDDLKAKILININIIGFKKISINIFRHTAIIKAC